MRTVLFLLVLLRSVLGAEPIQLLVRADDMGVSPSFNDACIYAATNGIVRSVEVIVPGQWFLHAVKQLQVHTNIDVGVHLCLTSEWENSRWRPLTHAPSLVDADGYFKPMTRQRKDFPPNTGFVEGNPSPAEVERELRAQIELIKKHLPRTSHVSAHMYAAMATPELKEITIRLAKEYGLLAEGQGLKPFTGMRGATGEEKIGNMLKTFPTLAPGKYLLVEHPGFDTPETRLIGHFGYYNVAEDRAGVTQAFTDAKVREAIRAAGIELIDYRALRGD